MQNDTLQILISGSDEELQEHMDADHAVVVDHRSDEEEVLRYLKAFVPELEASHSYDGHGGCHVRMSYRGKSVERDYGEIPYNCFRVVLEAERLLAPEIGIRVYAPTMGDDTQVFVILPNEAWNRFDHEASAGRKRLFQALDFLDGGWGLSGPADPGKKWRELWK